MAKTTTDRYAMYVMPDGQLDIKRIRREHRCQGETCRKCRGEPTPCSVRRAADKLVELRARPTRRGLSVSG